jgi:O-acetyl-ADP-ribose deacetylase (regulator of RNase III)
MSQKIYRNKFFKTEEEAKTFQREHGGALYRNVKYSHTKDDYMVEARQVACHTDEFIEEHPYCVAWNQFVEFEHIQGDLLKFTEADVIVHQVNCQGVMGAGIARQIRNQFPNTFFKYKELCSHFTGCTHLLLGTCQYVQEKDFIICNAFGQNFYYRNSVQTDYEKLEACFRDIATKYSGKHIALPWKIGCGLAGGDWDKVQNMIYRIIAIEGECKVTLVEWPNAPI